jgi:hypothetical protein
MRTAASPIRPPPFASRLSLTGARLYRTSRIFRAALKSPLRIRQK